MNQRYKELKKKREKTPPLPTAAPKIEGHGDKKKLCGNQRNGVPPPPPPKKPKKAIVK